MRAIAMPRVVFLGMRCRFSAMVLGSLIGQGVTPAAILLAGDPGEPPGDLPLEPRFARTGTIEAIARAERIPARVVAHGADLIEELRRSAPDLVAVACFPWRLSDAVLALPRFGALNVHPSLLPRHRGPEPLFWTFRHGDNETGVTVHEMTRRFDAGPVVEQVELAIPFGVEGAEFEARLAELGGRLLATAIERRAREDFTAAGQDEHAATTEGFPDAADLEISTGESGRFAYAFTRGIVSRGFTPVVRVKSMNERVFVAQATAWRPNSSQNEQIIRKNDAISIQFVDGICEFAGNNVRKTLSLMIDNAARPVR